MIVLKKWFNKFPLIEKATYLLTIFLYIIISAINSNNHWYFCLLSINLLLKKKYIIYLFYVWHNLKLHCHNTVVHSKNSTYFHNHRMHFLYKMSSASTTKSVAFSNYMNHNLYYCHQKIVDYTFWKRPLGSYINVKRSPTDQL